ncbi:hypothetical protein K490DRAFT_23539, partial [Saccharata proteae CBS 121410]
KKFILCFDGTGNKFSGTDADSNILKIYRMLDRNDQTQYHYYQPGIGTYVTSSSLSHTSTFTRLRSWVQKAKDSAVGTSFADHVMGGYKFLMRYYIPGDDIYFFGFSRGAYTARFLAEMLDHVGLLSAGNEEMARFAWKTFQKWQIRQERTQEEKAQKKFLLDFMCAFRETFSRPVRRIRFLGLFDTVNSVPRFENAWMQRSKFPYTAHSTAKFIRHAVAIDERRAKFRQDLISENKPSHQHRYRHRHLGRSMAVAEGANELHEIAARGRLSSDTKRYNVPEFQLTTSPDKRYGAERNGLSPALSSGNFSDRRSSFTSMSQASLQQFGADPDDKDDDEQDIQEVWFPGCHADIGGGWPLSDGEEAPLSHITLVWMVREAQLAGLNFDEAKLRALHCTPDEATPLDDNVDPLDATETLPRIQISAASPSAENGPVNGFNVSTPSDTPTPPGSMSKFRSRLSTAATSGKVHDVLQFNNGATATSVLLWNLMEYFPFRRMDLCPDGSWKCISWPLPKGEPRDVPDDAVIHNSVLRRIEGDETYRPGNIIIGGGGRGVRTAAKEHGLGRWKVKMEEGDPVGEVLTRTPAPQK